MNATVEPEWIDINEHLNVAYYHMAFDRATDRFFAHLGVDADFVRNHRGMMFALEDHITYQRELRLGARFKVNCQLLDFDAKRVHYFLRMYHDPGEYLASTCEHLSIFVDAGTRRAAIMLPETQESLAQLWEEHRQLPRPVEAGRTMRIRHR